MAHKEADSSAPGKIDRRHLIRTLGTGAASTAILATLASSPAAAWTTTASGSNTASNSGYTDTEILNFALNFEYLGAEFYLYATTGAGLPASDTTGTGTRGGVTGGTMNTFVSNEIKQYAQRLAFDETGHVRFLRSVLGASAIAQPAINLSTSWTTLARAAGLIGSNETFSPFAGDVDFLLGAYILEDVCVTALAGAAPLLSSATNIAGAAGLLGTEGYQAGAIRSLLADLGGGRATDAISALRAKLSGAQDDVGTMAYGNDYQFADVDTQGLVFRRTPQQVLNIAYGGGASADYGFFPNRVNGTIR